MNAVNKIGETALMWAAFEDHADIVNLLLLSGPDVNIVDNKGGSALMKTDNKYIKDKLIKFGARTNIIKKELWMKNHQMMI